MPTAPEFLNTRTLIEAVQTVKPVPHFFRDYFFNRSRTFGTKKVLAEYKDGSQMAASFLAPRVHGTTIPRDGYEIREFEPFIIGAKRVLTLDQLEERGFGEALYTEKTPQERQMIYLREDLEKLEDVIAVREEALCARVFFENAIVINEEVNDMGRNLEPKEVRFYTEDVNPAIYSVSTDWTTSEASGKQIYDDLANMIKRLRKRGLPANVVICGPEVMDVLLNNEFFIKKADNRQLTQTLNLVPQELPDGVVHFLSVNINGRIINFYSYDETYVERKFDENGKTVIGEDGQPVMEEKPFIPYGKIGLGAFYSGEILYGAISQKERDDQFHTYEGKRVPRYLSTPDDDSRSVSLRAKLLPKPLNKCPWVIAQVLTEPSD